MITGSYSLMGVKRVKKIHHDAILLLFGVFFYKIPTNTTRKVGIEYGSDYSPGSGANSYKAGNDDVFSLFHAETD